MLGIEFVFPRELMRLYVVSQKLNGHNDRFVQQVFTDMVSLTENIKHTLPDFIWTDFILEDFILDGL